MKLVLFADLHGNQCAWRAFLALLPNLKADKLIFLGDIFGYGYGQPEILEGMMGFDNLLWVKGNHDKLLFDVQAGRVSPKMLQARYGASYGLYEKLSGPSLEKLNNCQTYYTLELANVTLWAGHGNPDDSLDGRLYPKDLKKVSRDILDAGDVVIMGHTHFRLESRLGKTLLLNPGSLGQPRDFKPASIALLTLPEKTVEFIDIYYDRAQLERETLRYDPGNEKLVELLYRGTTKGIER